MNFGYENYFWADPAIIPLKWNYGNWEVYKESDNGTAFRKHGVLDNFYVREDVLSSDKSPFLPLSKISRADLHNLKGNITENLMRKLKVANQGYCPLEIGCVSTLEGDSPFV